MTPEERFKSLQMLRARRRAKTRGDFQKSPHELLATPSLPPWMTPSSLETASPLGEGFAHFNGMDVRKSRTVPAREYPSSIGQMGSNY